MSRFPLPAVPDTFEWTLESWGAALRCKPLQAIAPHLFTTRQLALSTQDDWTVLARSVGARVVKTLTQVHGRGVVAILGPHEVHDSGSRPEGDVLLSNQPEIALAVRAADCAPILIADTWSRAVAAVHAGWRGTAAAAVQAAVHALERMLGTRPGDVVAAIGPSIGPCCYEIGTDVVDAFAAAGHARHLVNRWFLEPRPRRGEHERSTLRLDIWTASRDQLVLAGVDPGNVHTCGLCTACHIDLFPSYRAEKEKAGRLAAVITARG